MTIRVLIADDQDMVRAGFRMILDAADGIEVVADTGIEATREILSTLSREDGGGVEGMAS